MSNADWTTVTYTVGESRIIDLGPSFSADLCLTFEECCDALAAKYPTFAQAWDHLKIVKRMCESEEEVV